MSQITVSKLVPGGSISGGVVLCNNTSTGILRPSTILPSLLGFGVEYLVKQGKAQSPKGKVNLYIASFFDIQGNSTFPALNWYKISSNAIASLAITTPSATFTSKANVAKYNPVTGELIAIEGNCTMVLDLRDVSISGYSNLQDLVGVTIYKNAGGVWYSNNWATSKTVPKNICGGDLTVSGSTTASATRTAALLSQEAERLPEPVVFSVRAYPNPSEHYFAINLQSTNLHDKIEIRVNDIAGRLVYVTTGVANREYRFGKNFVPGIYILEIRQADNRSIIKLIKQ
jgi:hypothetical protein